MDFNLYTFFKCVESFWVSEYGAYQPRMSEPDHKQRQLCLWTVQSVTAAFITSLYMRGCCPNTELRVSESSWVQMCPWKGILFYKKCVFLTQLPVLLVTGLQWSNFSLYWGCVEMYDRKLLQLWYGHAVKLTDTWKKDKSSFEIVRLSNAIILNLFQKNDSGWNDHILRL